MLIRLLLLAAALPLDLTGPSKSGGGSGASAGPLRVEAALVGRRVSAQLVNDGPPVRVLLGFTCSGPETFTLLVDGVERHFTAPRDCDKNVERVVELKTGARSEAVLSDELTLGAARRAQVLYRGAAAGHFCAGCFVAELRSLPIVLPGAR